MSRRPQTPRQKGFFLGERIRQARKTLRISLQAVSRGTGLSIAFLSRLESNKVNISVDNLRKIADFLDESMVYFFETQEDPSLGVITRKGQGTRLKIGQSNAYSESLIRKVNSTIQATLYTNPPGEGRKKPFSHPGEEFVYVLKGEVLFTLGKEEHPLKKGDSLYYRSETAHSFVSTSKGESILLIFNSPQAW